MLEERRFLSDRLLAELDQVLAESRRDRHFRIVTQCFFEVVDGLFLYRFVV